jgi:hypothetical protein
MSIHCQNDIDDKEQHIARRNESFKKLQLKYYESSLEWQVAERSSLAMRKVGAVSCFARQTTPSNLARMPPHVQLNRFGHCKSV